MGGINYKQLIFTYNINCKLQKHADSDIKQEKTSIYYKLMFDQETSREIINSWNWVKMKKG